MSPFRMRSEALRAPDLARPAEPPIPRARLVLVLLGLFSALNFGDKAILGLAGPAIIDDLDLTNTQFGTIASSFYLLYSISALLLGLFGGRWPATWTLAGMAVIWSVAQLPLLLPAAGFATLVGTRVLLGAGEGPGIPVATHVAFSWWRPERRTMVSGTLAVSGALGVILGGPLLAVVIVAFGWRWAFGVLGILGLGWAVLWAVSGGTGPFTVTEDEAPADATTLIRLLRTRTMAVALTAGFAAQWLLGLAMSWLPSYLEKAQGFEPRVVGLIVGLPSFFAVVTVPLVIVAQRRMAARGRPARRIYGSLGLTVTLLPAAALLLLTTDVPRPLVLLLAGVAFGVIVALNPLIAAAIGDLTPYHRRGAVLCLFTAIASLGAVAAPWCTGRLLDLAADESTGYANGFRLAAGLAVLAGLVMLALDPGRDVARRRAEVAAA
jgi:MFS family permease